MPNGQPALERKWEKAKELDMEADKDLAGSRKAEEAKRAIGAMANQAAHTPISTAMENS